jgi:hypothetical protein
MCLKCFSRRAVSFAIGLGQKYHLYPFFIQKYSPKNEAGDSYKNEFL